jgi:rod shape determining protein RodA
MFGQLGDHFDWVLFLLAATIGVIGVVNLYSATSVAREMYREVYIQQVYWLVGGGMVATIAAAVDYRHYERFGYALYGFGVVLLVLVFILGREVRGSSRWIYLGPLSFQPSEVSKLFLIIALAKFLHDDPKSEGRTLPDLILPALITAVPTGLIVLQPDLGTALIHMLIFGSVCAITGIRLKSVLSLALGAVVAAPIVWTYGLQGYQNKRITAWLNPEENILGDNWDPYHSRIAIGHGGLTGQGFTKGSQNQFLFLHEQHTDFPFPVFAEDWGFAGCFALVSLYAFLVLWAVRIGSTAKDRFGAVLAVGVGSLVFWHAIFNLGMVTGLLPVVGVTLPLFGYGGSSVLTVLVGLGLLMNVSMRRFSAPLGSRSSLLGS